MEQREPMGEQEWEELTKEFVEALRTMRPSHQGQRDFEMIGQHKVLHKLAVNGGELTPGELARLCEVSSARIARACAQLEAQGLVVRTEDPADGRRTLVHLTPEGQRAADERRARIEASMRGFLQELGADDARELMRIMGKAARIMPAHFGSEGCCPVAGGTEGGRR